MIYKLVFVRVFKKAFFIFSSFIALIIWVALCIFFSLEKSKHLLTFTGLKSFYNFLIFLFPSLLIIFIFFPQFILDKINDDKNNLHYLIRSSKNNYLNFTFSNVLFYYLFFVGFSLIPLVFGLVLFGDVNNFYYVLIYFLIFAFFSIFENYFIAYLFFKKIRFLKPIYNYLTISIYVLINVILMFYSFLSLSSSNENIFNGFFLFFIHPFFYLSFLVSNNFSLTFIINVSVGSILSFAVFISFIVYLIKSDKIAIKYSKNNDWLIKLDAKLFSYYKKTPIFKNLNLEISKNQKIGILGRNGMGKSTLIKLLTGYFKPENGDLYFSSDHKFNICGAYQEFQFDSNFTCFQIFKKFSLLYKNNFDNEKVKSFLENFQIAEFSNEKYRNLSFGTKQKVKLVFALVNNPTVLILDEPFSGLDSIWISFYKDVLRETLKSKNISLVLISHLLKDQKEFSEIFYQIESEKLTKINSLEQYAYLEE